MINGIISSLVSQCYEDTRNASIFLQYMNVEKQDLTSVHLWIALKWKCCFQFWHLHSANNGTKLKRHKHEELKACIAYLLKQRPTRKPSQSRICNQAEANQEAVVDRSS